MAKETIAEKIERVFQTYKTCHDLDVALLCCYITNSDEQKEIRNNSLLKFRIMIAEAEYKANLRAKIETLSNSADKDSTRFNALKMLAQSDYPERFKEKLELSGNVEWIIKPRERSKGAGNGTSKGRAKVQQAHSKSRKASVKHKQKQA